MISWSMYDGFQIGGDVAAVPAERIEKPGRDVEQRHVVIAGNDELRERQRIEECARLLKLPASGALREVAGNGDEIRLDGRDALDERRDDPLVEAAEVQIGEVDEGAHPFSQRAQSR